MARTAKKLIPEALALPQDEKEELMDALSNSLQPVGVSPAWEQELERRVERIESGEASFQDAHDHLRELKAKLIG